MSGQQRGWAVFRLMDAQMVRVSLVGDADFVVGFLDFDEAALGHLKEQGISREDLYARPVDLLEDLFLEAS